MAKDLYLTARLQTESRKANRNLRELERTGFNAISDAYKGAYTKLTMNNKYYTTDAQGRMKFTTSFSKLTTAEKQALLTELTIFNKEETSSVQGIKGRYIPEHYDAAGNYHAAHREGGKYSNILNSLNLTDAELIKYASYLDMIKSKTNGMYYDLIYYPSVYNEIKQEVKTIINKDITMDDIETILTDLNIYSSEEPNELEGTKEEATARVASWWASITIDIDTIEAGPEEFSADLWGNLDDDI